MLRFRGQLPFENTLFTGTATVYHREGLTRRVLEGIHLERKLQRTVQNGITEDREVFLLVIPYDTALAAGDKVLPGIGPEKTWEEVDAPVISQLARRTLRGQFSHWEVRG